MTQRLSQCSSTVILPTAYSKIQPCLPCQSLQVEYFPSSRLLTHWCFCTFSYKVKTPLKSSPQMLPLEVFYPVNQEWLAEPLTLVSSLVNRDTRYQIECSISVLTTSLSLLLSPILGRLWHRSKGEGEKAVHRASHHKCPLWFPQDEIKRPTYWEERKGRWKRSNGAQ